MPRKLTPLPIAARSLWMGSTWWFGPQTVNAKRLSPDGGIVSDPVGFENQPTAGLLFQFAKKPLGGLTPCGWSLQASNPCQSHAPVPGIGKRESTSDGRIG